MGKIIGTHIKRHHIVKLKEIREAFNIPKGERIISFGLWAGLSPAEEEKGADSDKHEEWYIETKEVKGKQID